MASTKTPDVCLVIFIKQQQQDWSSYLVLYISYCLIWKKVKFFANFVMFWLMGTILQEMKHFLMTELICEPELFHESQGLSTPTPYCYCLPPSFWFFSFIFFSLFFLPAKMPWKSVLPLKISNEDIYFGFRRPRLLNFHVLVKKRTVE